MGLTRDSRILQIAPDPITTHLYEFSSRVILADYNDPRAAVRLDLTCAGLRDSSFDLVVASHVLEHIADEELAMREIARVLRPGGVAILPVPIVAPVTVEYPEPAPNEEYHVRANGLDYLDRLRRHFDVGIVTSHDVPASTQCYIYEDWSSIPEDFSPYRPPMGRGPHIDVVPICTRQLDKTP